MRGKVTYVPLNLAAVPDSEQPRACLQKQGFCKHRFPHSDGLNYSGSESHRSKVTGDGGEFRYDSRIGSTSVAVRNDSHPNSSVHHEGQDFASRTYLVPALIPTPDSSVSSPTDGSSRTASTKAPTISAPSTTISESVSWHTANDPNTTESQGSASSALKHSPQGLRLETSIQENHPISPLDGLLHLPTRPSNLVSPPLPQPNLPSRPPSSPAHWPRRPIHGPPTLGQVYYMPDGKLLPDSVIHHQKQQERFFKHPVLIVGLEGNHAHFYALTKSPPWAIRELNMCLRMGNTPQDDGEGVLKLAHGSSPMLSETWVNLEQRFYIEWPNLDQWAVDVRVSSSALHKIQMRVDQLEADQNRYIYKPLPRDMRVIPLGTVLMLLNPCNSATLGAPVLVVKNAYPHFEFLRIKPMEDNVYFNVAGPRRNKNSRSRCLEITQQPKMGHDGTPVMLLEPDSPGMREPSYVEVCPRTKSASLDMCKTWCWPPVRVRPQSMKLLEGYMARLPGSTARTAREVVTNSISNLRAPSVLYALAPPMPLVLYTASAIPGSVAYGFGTPTHALPLPRHNQYAITGLPLIKPMHTQRDPPHQVMPGYGYPYNQQYRGNLCMQLSLIDGLHLTSAYPRLHHSGLGIGYTQQLHPDQGGQTAQQGKSLNECM